MTNSFSGSHVDLSEKKYPEKDYCFAEWRTRVKKLAGITPTAFYSADNKNLGENYIRFGFIKVSWLLIEKTSFWLSSQAIIFQLD